MKLSAFLVANQLDIKGIKAFLDIKPLADSSSELYYSFSGGKYQYYFNYGVVVFAGYGEDEMKWAIKAVTNFQKSPPVTWLRDDHELRQEERNDIAFQFDEVLLGRLDDKVIRIAMFNLAQSVALDYYHGVSETLLTEVKGFANQLQLTGKLKISRKNMMRFIGKALSTQNEIAENIYVFDAPELVWDDEYLDKLQQGLAKHFDLRVRFSEVEYTLRIIEDNLSVFREITHQRENTVLEYIIIILILVEVFDLLITKILRIAG
ncbi:RMD1 family protein [Dawidia soli]|uniref:RMD1 family protein n=1 Tax=Dawidia soli TaxID=2782352 RepID=UPI0020B3A695|nr:RMD1 family protein [Dawidia soli]